MKHKKIYLLCISIILLISVLGIFLINSHQEVNVISKSATKQDSYNIKELITNRIENEEIISLNNCDYKYSNSGNLILRDYIGYADSVRIPEIINGKLVEGIESDMFSHDENLETIRVPKKIARNIDEIEKFQINEELSNEEFVVYLTTKTYNDQYLKYIQLSDSAKAEYKVIPPKFIITLDEYIKNKKENETSNKLLRTHNEGISIPEKYDLRDHITITKKYQSNYGICYACTSMEAVETNIALKMGVEERLSEVHLAMVSEQFRGGLFVLDNSPYYSLGYGPVKYSDWNISNVELNKDTDPICKTISTLCKEEGDGSVTDEEKNVAITKMKESVPDYYVLKTVSDFPTIDGDKKQGDDYATYESTIKEVRNKLKQHIMNNGALISGVYLKYGDKTQVRKNDDGKTCMYTKNKGTSENHEIAIVGWDDTFPASSFPTGMTPKHDGAWLAVNSWGNIWGDKGYCWISYDDYYVESWLRGVTSVHQGKVNLNECNISLKQERFDYNGIEQRPDVSFKYNGNTYTNGIDYTIEYRNNTNPGEATAVITGINRFTGTMEKHFSIEQEITGVNIVAENENMIVGDSQTLVAKTLPNNTTTTNVTWTSSDESIATIDQNGKLEAKKTGKVVITVVTKEENKTDTCTINIGTIDIRQAVITLNNGNYTYSGVEIQPTITQVKLNNNVLQTTDYSISYSNNKNAGTATIVITGVGRYSGNCSKTFLIVPKSLEIKANNKEIQYGQEIPILDYEVSGMVNGEIPAFDGNLKTTASSNSNIGTYDILNNNLQLKDNNNFKASNYTIDFKKATLTIIKANPSYNAPSGIVVLYGKTLKDIKLPEGFSWEDDLNTSVGEIGEHTFKCTYTPKDTANYNTITGINVTIKVSNKLELNTNDYIVEHTTDNINYLENIKENTNVEILKNNITTNGNIVVLDSSNNVLENEKELLKTGMKLRISYETEIYNYDIVITGDLNGDGKSNAIDLMKMARYTAKLDNTLIGAFLQAANVHRDQEVNNADLLKMARVLANLDIY